MHAVAVQQRQRDRCQSIVARCGAVESACEAGIADAVSALSRLGRRILSNRFGSRARRSTGLSDFAMAQKPRLPFLVGTVGKVRAANGACSQFTGQPIPPALMRNGVCVWLIVSDHHVISGRHHHVGWPGNLLAQAVEDRRRRFSDALVPSILPRPSSEIGAGTIAAVAEPPGAPGETAPASAARAAGSASVCLSQDGGRAGTISASTSSASSTRRPRSNPRTVSWFAMRSIRRDGGEPLKTWHVDERAQTRVSFRHRNSMFR